MPGHGLLLLNHDHQAPSVFTPQDVVAAVRAERPRVEALVPAVCILDFDGDLTDELVAERVAVPCHAWACFHTILYRVNWRGKVCGLIPRTIGGPYAVLVGEQLAVSGAQVVLGMTSAGGIAANLQVPSVVVADAALRDEGTSFHYLPPDDLVAAPGALVTALGQVIRSHDLPARQGLVWTTDAPYRETAAAVAQRRRQGVLAVEMQAASLFAFGAARGVPVGVAAHVTNLVGHPATGFDKGSGDGDRRLFEALCEAGWQFLEGAA